MSEIWLDSKGQTTGTDYASTVFVDIAPRIGGRFLPRYSVLSHKIAANADYSGALS